MTAPPATVTRYVPRWELTILNHDTMEPIRSEIFTTKKRATEYAIKRQISTFDVQKISVPVPIVTWQELSLPGFD